MSKSNLNFNVQSPPSLMDYVAQFVIEPSNNAKTLVYGGVRKLQERLQNIAPEDYPILHLERPNVITASDGSNINNFFYCSFNCYVKFTTMGSPEENDNSEILAENTALEVLQKLQKKIHHDSAKGIIEADIDGSSIDPVFDTFLANHLGWQLTIKIGFNANAKLC